VKVADRGGAIDPFVSVPCLCGKPHALLRDEVVSGLGLSRWKCGRCKRRFVIACTPESPGVREEFWPLFLDDVPRTGDTREDGISTDHQGTAQVPSEIHFQCRCGCRLVGKSRIYGVPTRCPRCASRLVLEIGYRTEDARPTALLKYPDDEREPAPPKG
jgi:hypothetical protein